MRPTVDEPFDLLHEKVKRWIWRREWTDLRDIQGDAIRMLVEPARDVVISATTASGKTEAAFLPILSRIAAAARPKGCGFEAVYVGPLRSLINDQFQRLASLCEDLDIPVHPWHGDIAAASKARALRRPSGVLLITPESIEALLVRRGREVAPAFAAVEYVVIDEMHAYLDAARGRQLQSLLERLDVLTGRRPVRIGLSATLAEASTACEFLRPGSNGSDVAVITSASGSTIELAQRGFFVEKPRSATGNRNLVDEVYRTTRGKRFLVFANSRGGVEELTDALVETTVRDRVPNEYFAHHGNLSREIREGAEKRIKVETLPTTVVCTTTLELGIDIGNIDGIEQVGPGGSVSGMRQRLGRSGRRPGTVSNLRLLTQEVDLASASGLADQLRLSSVQVSAMVRLMLRKWNEPITRGRLHLSTLVHQVLALIAQYGGITASDAYAVLVKSGVFSNVTTEIFSAVLRRMGHAEVRLIEQSADGTLLAGEVGESVISSRDFYAVFDTSEEYRIVTAGGRVLGTLPITSTLAPGDFMIFAGRRWRVTVSDARRREVLVSPAGGGRVPHFEGSVAPVHGEILREMRRLYVEDTTPPWCDDAAARALGEGRRSFERLGLRERSVVRHGGHLYILTWEDAPVTEALRLMLKSEHISCSVENGIALRVTGPDAKRLSDALTLLEKSVPPNALDLVRRGSAPSLEKYDEYLDDELRAIAYASHAVEPGRTPALASRLRADLEALRIT